MNQELLKARALDLQQLLLRHAQADAEAASLLAALSALIKPAIAGAIGAPLAWGDVPGAAFFSEGGLRRFSDLESAYAAFKIELTGGESPALRNLRSKMKPAC